jgi:hypothetical protein
MGMWWTPSCHGRCRARCGAHRAPARRAAPQAFIDARILEPARRREAAALAAAAAAAAGDGNAQGAPTAAGPKKPAGKKKKAKGSFAENFAVLKSSEKIRNLALLVMGYGVAHRCVSKTYAGGSGPRFRCACLWWRFLALPAPRLALAPLPNRLLPRPALHPFLPPPGCSSLPGRASCACCTPRCRATSRCWPTCPRSRVGGRPAPARALDGRHGPRKNRTGSPGPTPCAL